MRDGSLYCNLYQQKVHASTESTRISVRKWF